MKLGWKTVKLGEVAEMRPSKSEVKKKGLKPSDEVGFLPMEDLTLFKKQAKALQSRKMSEVSNSYTYFANGDVLMAKISPCFQNGKMGIATGLPNGVGYGSSEYFVFRPSKELSAEWLFYFLQNPDFRRHATGKFSGNVGQQRLPKELIEDLEIPLPPLAEQKRIVALLDEAFAGIDQVAASLAERIGQTDSILQSKFNQVFAQPPVTFDFRCEEEANPKFSAKGRKATSRNIAGSLSLCVGKPSSPAKDGWRWVELSSLAQLESGHTPSRAKPEYWNGKIPWISIRDAKKYHGKVITDTQECITEQGVENSSARILPASTVCLSRTASVGYCVITGKPMATSQDFVNWVINGDLSADFLKYIFLAEGEQLLRFASGSVHQTIYYPETKAFAVCIPGFEEQVRISHEFDELSLAVHQLRELFVSRENLITSLKASILSQAFAGQFAA